MTSSSAIGHSSSNSRRSKLGASTIAQLTIDAKFQLTTQDRYESPDQLGGAKHEPGEKDNIRKMHPRSSFKAFLKVVKIRSLPWKDYEMDISLLIKTTGKHLLTFVEDSSVNKEHNIKFEIKTHGSKVDSGPINIVLNDCANKDLQENVVEMCFVSQAIPMQKIVMDKTDEFGWYSGWNLAMTKFTSWQLGEVINKMLLGGIFGTNMACCHLKNQNAFINLGIALNSSITAKNLRRSKLDSFIGQSLHFQLLTEQTSVKRLKAFSYIKGQVHNPLASIIFSRKNDENAQCQQQLRKILDDSDIHNIVEGFNPKFKMRQIPLNVQWNCVVYRVCTISNISIGQSIHKIHSKRLVRLIS
ncbi:hypothetical protein K2173_022633 [Erythroxylum novogranatense]|uniref:Phytochrome central region domain-containing protein n=1 Tax=Erythroxylum novogranatense TaxID=1862640 RepID=A0AAV8TNI1_9ROSI|nr:hypothetical protein K2173_022633 [Erythroxylum novogranatense]